MAAIGCLGAAVSLPSGFNMESQAVSLRETEPTEDVTVLGASGNYTSNIGASRLTLTATVSGFANSSRFGIGLVGGSGASATFALDTGRTVIGTWVVRDKSIGANATRFGVPCSLELINNGAQVSLV